MSSLSHVQGNVGYTFPDEDPVLWYRGRVNADSQGRYLKGTLATMVVLQKKLYVTGIRSEPPIHADMTSDPLYTTITR